MTRDPVARFFARQAGKSVKRARLRPMDSSEVIDLSLRTYRELGWSFLRVSLVPSLFCLAALAFLMQYVLPALGTTSDPTSTFQQIGEVSGVLALAVLVAGPLFLTGLSYTSAAIVRLVSDHLEGRSPDVEAAQQIAGASVGKMLLVTMRELLLSLSGVIVAVLLMFAGGLLSSILPDGEWFSGLLAALGVLGIFGGVILFLIIMGLHALVPPIVVLEGKNGPEASRRSTRLMKNAPYHGSGNGHITAVYGLLGFAALILLGGFYLSFSLLGLRQVVEELTAGVPFQGVFLQTVELIPAFLTVWTLIPAWAAATTIVYYERRIRLEGYDIETLAADL